MEQAPLSSSPSGPTTPAEWYPDPTGRFEFRYYNGVSWTGDVSVDGHRFLDPLRAPADVVGPTGFVAPAMHGQFTHEHATGVQGASAKAKAAFVLGLCSFLVGWVPFLCLLAAGAAVVALVFAIGELRRERRAAEPPAYPIVVPGPITPHSRPPGRAYTRAGLVLAPLGLMVSGVGVWLSVLTIREVQHYTEVGSYGTSQTSCIVADGRATYTGTITNTSATVHSYDVTVEFVRTGTSSRLAIDSVAVNDVAPGEAAAVVVSVPTNQTDLECRLVGVTGPLPFGQS